MLHFCVPACCAILAGLYVPVNAAPPAPKSDAPKSAAQNAVPPLIQQMVGTWNVQQRMWPKLGAPAVNMPPAVAKRRLLNQVFIEETMEAADKNSPKPFTRTALINITTIPSIGSMNMFRSTRARRN